MLTFASALFALAFLLLVARLPLEEGEETIGLGSSLEIDDGGGDTFLAVPKIEMLGVPNETTGVIESKTLDLEDATIRKLATLKDGGTFDFRYQVIATTWDRIEAIRKPRTTKRFRVSVPVDTGTIEVVVPGIITANKFDDVEPDKMNTATVTVTVSGKQE